MARLARQVSDEYRGKPLTILGVLTGSIMLVTDLMRQIDWPHKLGLLQASSYRGARTVADRLMLDLDSLPDLTGRHVLVVDDIFDTGRTMQTIVERLSAAGPLSVRSAVLLWKKVRTEVSRAPDFYGFEIPDEFVVGYGLDYNEKHRNLSDIVIYS